MAAADGRGFVVDCDPGTDDALAIAVLHHARPGSISLVTTVAGNAGLERVTANAVQVCEHLGTGTGVLAGCDRPLVRDPIVRPGIHGPDALAGLATLAPVPPGSVHASIEMVEVLNVARRPMVVVALGPLTNLAVAVALDPSIPGKVSHLVTAADGFNREADPEAARRVGAAGFDLVEIPLGVSAQVPLPNAGEVSDPFLAQLVRYMAENGRQPHDVAAALVALGRDPAQLREGFAGFLTSRPAAPERGRQERKRVAP